MSNESFHFNAFIYYTYMQINCHLVSISFSRDIGRRFQLSKIPDIESDLHTRLHC